MNKDRKDQLTCLTEGLLVIRPLKTSTGRPPTLQERMRLQRWLLREITVFYPNESLLDVVTEVISPAVQARYPH